MLERTIFLAIISALLIHQFSHSVIDPRIEAALSAKEALQNPRDVQGFILVSDLDHDSRHPLKQEWKALVQHGELQRTGAGRFRISFGRVERFKSYASFKNRSLELSEAVVYGGKLLAMCDVSGTVYELDLAEVRLAVFWQHMFVGEGLTDKPFKTEWATVHDGDLLLVSIGKEWVQNRQITGFGPVFIKRLRPNPITGQLSVLDEDWGSRFARLREATNTTWPGYLLHEAIEFDPLNRRWLVLPRRVSSVMYDPDDDEYQGGNLLLLASEDFVHVQVKTVGKIEPEWGFTSLSIIPGSDGRQFIVVKAREAAGVTESKVSVIDDEGRFLLDPVSHPTGWAFPTEEITAKYEGVVLI